MKSVKISETANIVVVNLSEKFRMSKQAFVSLILENIVVDDVVKLQARDIIKDVYSDYDKNVGQLKSGYRKDEPEFDYEDDEEEDTIEFEEDDEDSEVGIEGL